MTTQWIDGVQYVRDSDYEFEVWRPIGQGDGFVPDNSLSSDTENATSSVTRRKIVFRNRVSQIGFLSQ